MHLSCTWILRTVNVAHRVSTGPATIYLTEGFCQTYSVLRSRAKFTRTALSLPRIMLDDYILSLPRSLIYLLGCQLDCYLMAIIGLGGFQVNMRRTGIESHHSHSRDRTSASYVPTSILLRGVQLCSHFGQFYDWPHQVHLLSLSLAC